MCSTAPAKAGMASTATIGGPRGPTRATTAWITTASQLGTTREAPTTARRTTTTKTRTNTTATRTNTITIAMALPTGTTARLIITMATRTTTITIQTSVSSSPWWASTTLTSSPSRSWLARDNRRHCQQGDALACGRCWMLSISQSASRVFDAAPCRILGSCWPRNGRRCSSAAKVNGLPPARNCTRGPLRGLCLPSRARSTTSWPPVSDEAL
mmetsp:Transcript_27835/g.74995  ORF Transcript_27835/g.74995 Transcript_27835/m.74995 type:complete len:213 (+) Transcript_27835:211-849(+)